LPAQQFPIPPLPRFTPIAELTVCPEGPPACQFKKIQDAINAAPEVPSVSSWVDEPPQLPLVRIFAGTYEEKVQIIAKNVWLRGEGQVILRPGIFVAGFLTAIGIEGLSIQGRIDIVGALSGVIAKNEITGSIVLLGASANLLIVNNYISNSVGGIALVGISAGRVQLVRELASDISVFIAENEISEHHRVGGVGGWGQGIFARDVQGMAIIANRIRKNLNWGISLFNATAGIADNVLEGNGVGIDAIDGQVAIFRNRVERQAYTGIEVSALSGGEYWVQANQIRDNKNEGIKVRLRAEIRILENLITGNGAGLSVARVSDVKACKDNQIFGNQTDYYTADSPIEELRRLCEGK
jgi:hypothetical protein